MSVAQSTSNFVTEVKAIPCSDRPAARAFYEGHVASLRRSHPDLDAEKVARSNIGFCFAEGMSVAARQMWRDVCGAEHPGLGPRYTDDLMSPSEWIEAGKHMAEQRAHERKPTSWSIVLGDEKF